MLTALLVGPGTKSRQKEKGGCAWLKTKDMSVGRMLLEKSYNNKEGGRRKARAHVSTSKNL